MGRPTATAAALAALLAAGCGGGGDGAGAGGSAGTGSGSGAKAEAEDGAGGGSGAGATPGGRASCDAIDAAIVGHLTPPDLVPHVTPQMEIRMRAALIAACRRDRWSAEALDCASRTPAAARDRCPGRMTAAQAKGAGDALVVEVMTAIAEPAVAAAPSGPHRDYPTAALAGTDKLFTMVEPERGPKAPLGATIPRGLTWTNHGHCTPDLASPVCGRIVPDTAGLWSWRVGRRGAGLVVLEERRGARIDRTFVYTLRPDGTPVSRVKFDAYERVESALLFQGTDRYSGRKRNGANALDGCGFLSYKLDANRRAEELACLQWKGEPMLDTDGVARTRYVRDAAGLVVEEHRFDLAGKPVANAAGVHKTLIERDADGRPVVERYRGVDDKPVASTQGCHGRRIERDPIGSVVKQICLDAAGAPTAQPSGVSAEVFRVDVTGCRTGVRLLSLRGTPAAGHDQVHAMDYEVDDRCAITSKLCRGLDDRPRPCVPDGPARYVTRYDAAGNAISVKHFDAIGRAGRDASFYAFELRRTYDRLGNQVTQACHDFDGEKERCPNTDFHAIRMVYDGAGREIVQSYRKEDERPTLNYGSAKRSYKYDNYDHLVETQNLDEQGALTEALGVAIRKDLYDTAHRRFGILLYDRAGQPARNTGCYTGATCPDGEPWHAVRIVRRPDGSVEKNLFFDEGKRLIDTKFCSSTPCFD